MRALAPSSPGAPAPGLVPLQVENPREPRAGERQQPVPPRARAVQFLGAQDPRAGSARVADDVGAGSGEMGIEFAPLAAGGELSRRRGWPRRGLCAGRVEPCRDAGMVDGVETEPAEGGHRVRAPRPEPSIGGGRAPNRPLGNRKEEIDP